MFFACLSKEDWVCWVRYRFTQPKSMGVAVGTGVTSCPPHRSLRAELPHKAPASGRDTKALLGIRMSVMVLRDIAVYQRFEPHPRQMMLLATPFKHSQPSPTYFCTEAAQPIRISGYAKVIEITTNHAPQPFSDFGYRIVHLFSQLRPYRFQRCAHPLLYCQAQYRKPSLTGAAATVRKSENRGKQG